MNSLCAHSPALSCSYMEIGREFPSGTYEDNAIHDSNITPRNRNNSSVEEHPPESDLDFSS